MDFDKALSILRKHNNGLTYREQQERDILIAAIDNLIEFAAAEEYQMIKSLPDTFNGDDFEEYESVCEKYNLTYAEQENSDVEYAAGIACWWIGISGDSVVTYMTQQDERVRDTHRDLEGISYLKSEFPEELIPPIDWCCRCYLMSDGSMSRVFAKLDYSKDIKRAVNPIFKESLATGGRIFGKSHPYFKNIPNKDKERLDKIALKIKQKFIPDA